MMPSGARACNDDPIRLIVLGSTGSVGVQTLETVSHLNGLAQQNGGPRFEVVGLAGGGQHERLAEQARQWGGASTALMQGERGSVTYAGAGAAEDLVCHVECDLVVQAIAGAAGLRSTLAAIELGRDIALANKESLVVAGSLIAPMARERGVRLLPVDSEHAALWQCLTCVVPDAYPPFDAPSIVKRAVLTASGGPFRTWTSEQMAAATPDDALTHPTWNMGPKITIDCATMMNKAFEVVEAHWLFGLEKERLGVLVHPQSIIHAFAELSDGSIVAQLGTPDMRTPIQQALTAPRRLSGAAPRLSLETLGTLTFEAPDLARFPALEFASRIIELGGTSGAVVNAASEAAVNAFLEKRIGFLQIAERTAEALDVVGVSEVRALDDVISADQEARRFVALSASSRL